jgi:hypothetical protein
VGKLPFLNKLLIIVGSCCMISLPTYLYLFGQKKLASTKLTTLIQKTPTMQALSPRFFSNYLGLNPKGKNIAIKRLDIQKINKKLKAFPIFKSIHAEFTKEGELEVNYHLRSPQYTLKDFSNCGVDEEGYLFPLAPFYTPKKLTQIYLGLQDLNFSKKHYVLLANQIIEFFNLNKLDQLSIALIDLSKMNSNLKSHQEVIVTIEFLDKKHYLRIHPQNMDKALTRYVSLFKESSIKDKIFNSCVFDARIQKFATLKAI